VLFARSIDDDSCAPLNANIRKLMVVDPPIANIDAGDEPVADLADAAVVGHASEGAVIVVLVAAGVVASNVVASNAFRTKA
jgi:hypothetical protein